MIPGLVGLDHLLIGVADLEAARQSYARLGFRATPRGRHIGWGTANTCLMFPDTYLELIGIVDSSQFVNDLDGFLERHGEGLLAAALRGDDLDGLAAALADKRLPCDGPKDLQRILELPDGELRPAFQTLFPPDEATPGLRSFVCRHLTPDMVWQPGWLQHPNGARALAGLTVVVAEPGTVANAYGDLFGTERVRASDNLVEIDCPGCPLRFTDAEGLKARHPQAADRVPEGPAAVEVAVADLGTAARRLETNGVPFRRAGEGRLQLLPQEACGVLLDFVQG